MAVCGWCGKHVANPVVVRGHRYHVGECEIQAEEYYADDPDA